MEKKILFLDLDGTLLTDTKDITDKNLETIQKAVRLGHAVVLTTGRPLHATIQLIERIGLTTPGCYAITANGAMIYDACKKETIFECGVKKELVRKAFDEAYRFGIHPQTYSRTHVLVEQDTPEIQFYTSNTLMKYEVVKPVEEALTEDPIKILFIDLKDHKKLENFRAHLTPWAQENQMELFFSCEEYLEMLPQGINKGSGIRFICEYLNVPLEQTLAAGDAENDITMLQTVHTPCVMKNARPEMYSYGTYITEHDNNHSGVAEIIEKFML